MRVKRWKPKGESYGDGLDVTRQGRRGNGLGGGSVVDWWVARGWNGEIRLAGFLF